MLLVQQTQRLLRHNSLENECCLCDCSKVLEYSSLSNLNGVGEKRLSLEEFKNRWRQCLRSEVKEAAPPHGLCLIRVGYDEKIFSKAMSFNTFPSFSLPVCESP